MDRGIGPRLRAQTTASLTRTGKALLLAGLVAGLLGVSSSPAHATECVNLPEGLRVCANGGMSEQGTPFVVLTISGNGSGLTFKTWIIEGEDYPRTWSIGVGLAEGRAVNIGVDLSGDPERTNVCIHSEPGQEPECIFVGDLTEIDPAP